MKNKKDKKVTVMIGGGDSSLFVKVKKGTKVYIGNGLWQEAGLTLEEARKRTNKKLDKMYKEIIREERKEQVKQKMKSIFRK